MVVVVSALGGQAVLTEVTGFVQGNLSTHTTQKASRASGLMASGGGKRNSSLTQPTSL